MYIPDIYKNDDQDNILDFIRNNGFAVLISTVGGKPWATHLPLVLDHDEDGIQILHGHLSIENPQWKDFDAGNEVLAVFNGPHAYVSSSWYDHENVPTWNYIAVHVYGKIEILDDDRKIKHLKKLTDKYEATSENPVRVENLSEKTMMQSRGIVVFSIKITDIQAVRKLSQNRDQKNHKAIVSELESQQNPGASAIANEMKKRQF